MEAPAIALQTPGDICLGVLEIDRVLGGGLACGALHEVAACGETHIAAATGFALAVTSTKRPLPAPRNDGTVVWVAEDMALLESGVPYGPGLDFHGLAPERLLTIAGAKADDVLWVMEEALHCRAVSVVIGEVRSTRELDLVATRRLSLAAAAHGATALLLRTAPGTEASAAATRWVAGAAPDPFFERGGTSSAGGRSGIQSWIPTRIAAHSDPPLAGGSKGIGPPRFDLALTRNRRGPLGSWMLEWSVVDASFILATHPEPMARTPVDRPNRAHAA
jgi:protein ImuA